MTFHQFFRHHLPQTRDEDSADGGSEVEKESSDRDTDSANTFACPLEDLTSNATSADSGSQRPALTSCNSMFTENCPNKAVNDPASFFNPSNDGDEEDCVEDEEEKHDLVSEKHLTENTRQQKSNNVANGDDMQIDSVLVQRAFESLKKENAKLQERLEVERRKTILLKPRYDYLEGHFIEYVQKREEYKTLIEQIEEERAKDPHAKPDLVNIETQTWKGILCSYCSKTQEIASNKMFRDFVECQTKNSLCVSNESYQELEQKFQDLKVAIKERETIYESRTEKAEIINLKAAVAQAKLQVEHMLRKNQHGQNCLETLQRIVVKLVACGPDDIIEPITPKEQHWIDSIVCKYEHNPESRPVSLTPSAMDFTKPYRSGSNTYTSAEEQAAAGDF